MHRRQVSRWFALLILGLGACGEHGGGGHAKDAGSDAGELELEPGDHALGSFRVKIGADHAVQVTHADAPERVLFEAPAQFAQIWAVDDDITEQSGSFTIKEDVSARCDQLEGQRAVEAEGGIELRATLACKGEKVPVTLRFAQGSERSLQLSLSATPAEKSAFDEVVLVLRTKKGERFVGFGEQFTYVDLRGHVVPVLVQEGGIGRAPGGIADVINSASPGAGGSYWSTYAPMPYYFTDRGRALLLDNDELSWFDLTAEDRVTVRLRGTELRGHILFGEKPLDIIAALTEHTGRMKALPDWFHSGAIVGMQGGTDRVREVLTQLEAHDTPIAAFWLQDWVGKRDTAFGSRLWWNWQLNETQYPGWKQLVADLKQDDIRVLTYVNPNLVDIGDDPAFTRNLFAEARDKGYLVKDAAGKPYVHVSGTFEAAIVDLTNPAAVRWLKDVIRDEVLGVGASGYMADFGEAIAFDAKLASGEDAALVHNRFPELWAQLNRELLEEQKRLGQVVYFMRSGYTKSPGLAALFWAGDQMTDWDGDDGMASALKGILSGGLSGMSLHHSDIGGYTGFGTVVRSLELLLRWMEWSAFTAVYRTHEGNQPTMNAQFYSDDTSLSHFAKFAKLYAALAPYRRTLMQEAEKTGAPLVRHLLLEAPEDPEAWKQDQELMLGSDVLVAPVLAPGATKVSVYLPAGQWVHLWSGKTYAAGDHEVSAPLGEPAVFYRAGSAAGKALAAAK